MKCKLADATTKNKSLQDENVTLNESLRSQFEEFNAETNELETKVDDVLKLEENAETWLEVGSAKAIQYSKTISTFSRETADLRKKFSEIKTDEDNLSLMLLEVEDRAKVSATNLSNIMAEEDEIEGKLSELSKSVKMAEASFIQSLDENNCISQERDGLIRKLEVMSCEK